MPRNFQKFKMPLLLWSVVTLFFAFQFILRLSVGILRDEIIAKYAIDVITFGNLAGFYYLGYAGAQIPLGIMLDKYNFRHVTALAIVISVLGTLTFVLGSEWEYVLMGRFMIGMGSGVGFLAVAKVIKLYFEEKYHTFMIGMSFTFGLLGAVFGGKPMKLLFNYYGYNACFLSLCVTGLVIALIILLTNDKKTDSLADNLGEKVTLKSVFQLITNPAILVVSISGGLMVGSLEGFADVWAMPFFSQIYNIPLEDAILAATFVFMGMCVGGPILASIAEFVGSTALVIVGTSIATIILFAVMFIHNDWSLNQISALMFVLGILCCYQVLVFSITGKVVAKHLTGMAIAIVNCINMSFGHLFHHIIASYMQDGWDGKYNDANAMIYSAETFHNSLMIIPVACTLGMLGFLYLYITDKK